MNFKSSFFILLLLIFWKTANCQTLLSEGDSLYAAKKYTEAFEIYSQIFEEGNITESMLLKMAFIKEGLQDYGQALIYLNLYYKISGDRKALDKIQELADAERLEGYEYSDKDFVLTVLIKYSTDILMGLGAISLGLLAGLYYQRKKGRKPSLNLFFQGITLLLFFFVANNFFLAEEAIIKADQTLIVTAPSAAGEPVDVISKGHKVTVLEETDIWVKILWNDQIAYVRKGQVSKI